MQGDQITKKIFEDGRTPECPCDIVDAIGGWTTEGIGQRYGKGYNLNIKAKWMEKLLT
jgi:hypothetical protein